jgi:hypothetical protein
MSQGGEAGQEHALVRRRWLREPKGPSKVRTVAPYERKFAGLGETSSRSSTYVLYSIRALRRRYSRHRYVGSRVGADNGAVIANVVHVGRCLQMDNEAMESG